MLRNADIEPVMIDTGTPDRICRLQFPDLGGTPPRLPGFEQNRGAQLLAKARADCRHKVIG
jgi:hypothetical protein